MLSNSLTEKIENRLKFIYKENYSIETLKNVLSAINHYQKDLDGKKSKWNEKDIVLITYGDSIIRENEKPLKTLNTFLKTNLKELTYVHILPFFPYSSDDGFSVIDYYKVNPELGDWQEVKELAENFDVMFDLVINHVSQHSEWFKKYLNCEEPEKKYFIDLPKDTDVSQVTRPRSTPLLTPYDTKEGTKYVWTTFSADQVDLNFESPEVLVEMIQVLLFYISKGAKIIRLDAIAFLWKERGTTCLHLPETHEVVKLLRDVSEAIDPDVIILTETNVPNKENLSYFGDGDEAHMVYQFSLPPLLLNSLFTGNATYLTQWASTLPEMDEGCTFFNFTASHDGVGVRPLEGLVPDSELQELLKSMKEFGGQVSTKSNPDGSTSPYEINITYFDSMKGTKHGLDDYQAERFLCSQTVMLALQGIPAFYIHSFTATPNYTDGVKETGRARTINRMKWDEQELTQKIESETVNARVFKELKRRMGIRKTVSAFHPDAKQEIMDLGNALFAFKRNSRSGERVYVLNNITNKEVSVGLPEKGSFKDLLHGKEFGTESKIQIKPYESLWIYKD